MRRGVRIALVIPARNEALALPGVLRRVPAWVDTVVVADNGSSDATAAVAVSAGARVVHVPTPGYGAACHAGSVLAAREGAEITVFLDADGSDDPREMARVVDPIHDGRAELVVGRRGGIEAMPPQQRLGTAFVCGLLSLGFGVRVLDLGPFRAIRTSSLTALALRDRAFGWTAEMQARALRLGLRVREVPVSWRPGAGRSEITGTWRGVLRAAYGLTRHSLREILGAWCDALGRARWRRAGAAAGLVLLLALGARASGGYTGGASSATGGVGASVDLPRGSLRPRTDATYEHGKAIALGRHRRHPDLAICVRGEDAEPAALSSRPLRAYRHEDASRLAADLVRCETGDALALEESDLRALLHYLDQRYRLRIRHG